MKCEICEFESDNLEEVSYYDINGNSYSDEQDIERNSQNPDALAHQFCGECAEIFNFDKASQFSGTRVKVKDSMRTYGFIKVNNIYNADNLKRIVEKDITEKSMLDSILSIKVEVNISEEEIELDVKGITGRKGTLVFNNIGNAILFSLILEKDAKNEILKLFIKK